MRIRTPVGNPFAWLRLASLGFLYSWGCSFAPVELDGLRCPCARGWECVADVCVESGAGTDLGPVDGPDLGPADGGHGDASAPDLGLDATVEGDASPGDGGMGSVCETSTALFCDGFESGLGTWDETTESGTGASVSADGMPFLGERSAHCQIGAPSGRASVSIGLEGVTSGTVHARAWVYVPSPSEHHTLSVLVIAHVGDSVPLVALQILPDRSQVYIGGGRIAQGAVIATPPRDRWMCMSLSVDVASDEPRVFATIDGRVAADETLDAPLLPAANLVVAGIENSNAGPSGELFIDEVEVGLDPLPCP